MIQMKETCCRVLITLLAFGISPFSEAQKESISSIYVGDTCGSRWILSSGGKEGERIGIVQNCSQGLWWRFNQKESGDSATWVFESENVTILSPWFSPLGKEVIEREDWLIQIPSKGGDLLLPDPLNPSTPPIKMERWISLEIRAESQDVALELGSTLGSDTEKIRFEYPKMVYLSPPIEGIKRFFDQQIASMQKQFVRAVQERQEQLQMDHSYIASSRQVITVYFVEISPDAVWMLFYADQYALLSSDVSLATLLLKKGCDGDWRPADPAPVDLKELKPSRITYGADDRLGNDLDQPEVMPEGWLPRSIGIWPAGIQNPPASGITFAEFQGN